MISHKILYKLILLIPLLTIDYLNSQVDTKNNYIDSDYNSEMYNSIETSIVNQNLLSDCNIGNEFIKPNTTTTYGQNILFVQHFNLSEEGYLTGFGFTGINSISQIKMALYDDLNGSPNNLLIESDIAQMDSGLQVISVPQTTLNIGDYWIAFIMDASDFIDHWLTECTGPSDKERRFMILDDFEVNLPNNFSENGSYFNNCSDPIFAQIVCNELSTGEYVANPIEIYPNPVKDKLYVTGLSQNETYTIYSILGKKITSNILTINSYIDTSILNNGLYFIKFSNGFSHKFLKN